LRLSRVIRTWWPLAASWLLMGVEQPVLSAVVARLPDARIHLAAYGGIVWPLALIIESPIIMLISASTALSKDWPSYRKMWNYMMIAGGGLTALHALVAFTPLYYVVVRGLLGVPEEIIEPARIGLQIMLPWTWTIAYRRFNQGVMIRFGHSRSVGAGTVVRLVAGMSVLFAGLLLGTLPGVVVATLAVAVGVSSEALFAGRVVRPVLRNELAAAPPVVPPLTYRAFFQFYIPLVLTSLLSLLAQPIGSAALSRMPDALSSLAVWPVVTGLVFMARSLGLALNETVVALLDETGARPVLRQFTIGLCVIAFGILVLVAATPLSQWWFEGVSALPADLSSLARTALWFGIPVPALIALQSWYQGQLLHSRHTRAISDSVVIFLLVTGAILIAGVALGNTTGVFVGMVAMLAATIAQTVWLGIQAHRVAAMAGAAR